MTLPSKFQFKHLGRGELYTATYFDGQYIISWSDVNGKRETNTYLKTIVQGLVSLGDWVIHKEPKPESELVKTSLELCNFIHDKKDASELISGELEALHLLRRLITRLLDGRS